VPAGSALGGGSPQHYVDGLHNALYAGAGLAAVAAIAAAVLIKGNLHHETVGVSAEAVPEAA
jgi:hypothetical protein